MSSRHKRFRKTRYIAAPQSDGLSVVYSTERKSLYPERIAQDAPHNEFVPTNVPDPSESGATITVLRSIRDDILARLFARGDIDQAQYDAGRKWESLVERSQLGGARAIDIGKERVDGSPRYEIISDDQIKATWHLAAARRKLGDFGHELVEELLWKRHTLRQAAVLRGKLGDRGVNYIGRRFAECLETLAVHWGFTQARQRI